MIFDSLEFFLILSKARERWSSGGAGGGTQPAPDKAS